MMLRFFRVSVLSLAAVALSAIANAAEPELPFTAPAMHLGVASCGGSSCHGALEPWKDSSVKQDEFHTWQTKDAHAKAYKTLLSEKSKRIAANLGLPNAYEAKICLDCHADNVAPEKRANGFQISDGVGCEACHGGAVEWLGQHASGKFSHGDNVKAGLFPTEEPVARAKLCLSCHFGDKDRFITHRIMGAGHPRMSFSLDTFTAVQPAHFVVDADYKKRKVVASHAKVWAVGEVIAIDHLLDALTDPKRNQDGIFPELVFYDCHACHHPMSNVRWEPRESAGIGPGIPRLSDANLIMMGVLLDHMDPALAKDFQGRVKALHQASLKGHEATLAAAQNLKALTGTLTAKVAAMEFSPSDMRALLNGVIASGVRGEYIDYAAAEQATMALAAIIDAMKDAGMLTPPQYQSLTAVLNKCYDAVEKDEAYEPKKFLGALHALEAAVPKA
jgi:hypothetical protein